ncbi:hypothetical protein QQP08_027535 [Theobroma cacao]|nr:hypothetical protein QQP08_027535 [Theobroma cacao]
MSNYIHSKQTLEKKTQGPNKEPQRLVILQTMARIKPMSKKAMKTRAASFLPLASNFLLN